MDARIPISKKFRPPEIVDPWDDPTDLDVSHDRAFEMDLAGVLTERLEEFLAKDGLNRNSSPHLLRGHHYSQKEVARKMGVNRVRLCQFEMGTHYPCTLDQWRRWARALGMKLNIELR